MTNREKFNQKILSLSDKQLASYFSRIMYCAICPAEAFCYSTAGDGGAWCSEVVEAWFKQEVKDDEQEEIQSEAAQSN